MITLRQLTHARTLAKLGNFRRAAQVLHLTQPALTRSIQALEAELGVQLFNRLAHAVEPTRFGEAFLPKAHLLLQVHDDLTREMKVLADLEQVSLRVTLGPFPYDLHAPEVIARLGSAHPGLQCRLRLETWREVTDQVLRREADIGAGDLGSAEHDARLETEVVGRHGLHFYCRAQHPILSRPSLSVADLTEQAFACTRGSVRMGSMLVKLGGRSGTVDASSGDFIPTWEVESVPAAKRMVAASDALGVALLSQIRHELDSGALCLVPLRTPWLRLAYGFIRRRDSSPSPGTLSFMALFREREAALAIEEAGLLAHHGLA